MRERKERMRYRSVLHYKLQEILSSVIAILKQAGMILAYLAYSRNRDRTLRLSMTCNRKVTCDGRAGSSEAKSRALTRKNLPSHCLYTVSATRMYSLFKQRVRVLKIHSSSDVVEEPVAQVMKETCRRPRQFVQIRGQNSRKEEERWLKNGQVTAFWMRRRREVHVYRQRIESPKAHEGRSRVWGEDEAFATCCHEGRKEESTSITRDGQETTRHLYARIRLAPDIDFRPCWKARITENWILSSVVLLAAEAFGLHEKPLELETPSPGQRLLSSPDRLFFPEKDLMRSLTQWTFFRIWTKRRLRRLLGTPPHLVALYLPQDFGFSNTGCRMSPAENSGFILEGVSDINFLTVQRRLASNLESSQLLRGLHDVRLIGLLHARFKIDISTSGEPTGDIRLPSILLAGAAFHICYFRIGWIPRPYYRRHLTHARINYAVDGDLNLFAFGFLAAFGTLTGTSFRYIGSSDQRLFAAAPALRASHCCGYNTVDAKLRHMRNNGSYDFAVRDWLGDSEHDDHTGASAVSLTARDAQDPTSSIVILE
ncbi:hypothetical protein BDZ89DRAFT_1218002 [Hymenopellis radicata]|nr:hypothetical protein BDZ89DRAFT_1218002 [Hymenopellis radicata]